MAAVAQIDPQDIAREEAARLQSLVAAGLVANDPEAGPGLVFPLPADATIACILGGYDTKRSLGRKIRCAACPQHQPHFRGFRVQLLHGLEANIGFNCGEQHFGEGAWKAALSEYDRRVEEAHFAARVAPALIMIERVMPVVEAWHDKSKAIARHFGDFRRELPDLHRVLLEAARLREGRLETETRVHRKVITRIGREESKMDVDVTLVGRIPFPAFFLGSSPNSSLVGAKQDMGIAVALLTQKTDTASMAKAFRSLQRARQHLQGAADLHEGALLNLNPAWLIGLCKWANQHADLRGYYEVEGGTISRTDAGNSFSLPTADQLGPSPRLQIEALWEAPSLSGGGAQLAEPTIESEG